MPPKLKYKLDTTSMEYVGPCEIRLHYTNKYGKRHVSTAILSKAVRAKCHDLRGCRSSSQIGRFT